MGLFLFAGLLIVAIATRLGERKSFAQSTATPETSQAQNSAQPNAPGAVDAQTSATGQQAKAENHDGAENHDSSRDDLTDPKKKQIAEQSANLLKLANSLKADVDKTTPDTLSVPVIREADEIEKLARKMRSR